MKAHQIRTPDNEMLSSQAVPDAHGLQFCVFSSTWAHVFTYLDEIPPGGMRISAAARATSCDGRCALTIDESVVT